MSLTMPVNQSYCIDMYILVLECVLIVKSYIRLSPIIVFKLFCLNHILFSLNHILMYMYMHVYECMSQLINPSSKS